MNTPNRSSARVPTPLRLGSILLIIASQASLGCVPGPRSSLKQIKAVERREVPSSKIESLRELRTSSLVAGDDLDPRVIYIHGTPGDATAWADYLVSPIADLHAIAIDRPGFGFSTPARAFTRFEDQAAVIEPLLVQRDGRWPIIVGHSLGGPIAARVAADYPDRVGGLVLLAASLDPSEEETKWYNHAVSTLRPMFPKAIRHSNDEIVAGRRETNALAKVLANVRCPVIIIHGSKDHLVPIGNATYSKSALTHAEYVDVQELAGEGHFLPWKREKEVRSAIEQLRDRPAK